MITPMISQEQISAYQRDGVVLVRGLLTDWVETIRAGITTNMKEPGPYAAENLKAGEQGRFFDDYCNWSRIPEFEQTIRDSPLASVAAQLMQSNRVQLFHDHVLVKEPGTSKPTPWHQDSPYYFVDGMQNVSFWSPMDAVTEATLRCVAGSHRWAKPVLPTRWLSEENFYPNSDDYIEVPNPDKEGMDIRAWDMQPGDAVAFHYGVLHGARGNDTKERRRAFSVRLLGDDARFVQRPGRTSPPFPDHNMQEGDRLREDWFPILLDT